MNNNCEKIRDQIAELITGVLGEPQIQAIQQHLDECSQCREYARALQKEDKSLAELFSKLDADMATRAQRVIEAVNRCALPGRSRIISVAERFIKSRITRFAAAAVLLIFAGYAAGRLSASQELNAEQLRALESSLKASLEPAISRNVSDELDRRWQLVLAGSFIQFREDLNEQFRAKLNEFAVQTLAASSVVTNRLLTDLIVAINTAQTQDRKWVAAALGQIEFNRLQDKQQFISGLETLAIQTGEELLRTRQDMGDIAKLLVYDRSENLFPDTSENMNNLNERSKK